MRVVSAKELPAPTLPFEEVPCEPLGGAVRVRALLLSQRLAMESKVSSLRAKHPDNPEEATYIVIPEMLSIAVVDAKDQPIYSVHRWEVFGAQHTALALELFNVAWRLSGMSGEAAKKN
jgi:hypothetical protein